MRDSKKKWLAALSLALLPCIAGAAGLGRLNVLSALGQPLVGEIELISVTREELGSLSARLAQPEAYTRANLQYNPALAGARVTIERRANGQHYLKVTSTRPVTEPFIDVLVEISWAAGRLSREYTALLDPPGMTAPDAAPVIAAMPESRPAPAPAPVAQAPAAPSRPIEPAAPMADAREYGPIQRGETLGKIAEQVKPEGVTLEQMLVALYRSNPDAFIQKNLNLVRSGKILRVPDRDEIAAIPAAEAVKEYRAHVTDWNSYRQRLADAASAVPAEGRTAMSGKITTRVEDPAAASGPKDVVRVTRGAPPGGKPQSAAERVRTLEEEAIAREKALNEANERIAQLEKTIKDMQKLVELKSPELAAMQRQAEAAKGATPATKPADKPAAQAQPAKPAAAEKPAKVAEGSKAAPAPKPKPKPKAKPPAPAPEPDLMDEVIAAATNPLYLGVGGGAIVLGGLAFWMARRRRRGGALDEGGAARGAAAVGTAAVAADSDAAAADSGEDMDPLAEADVFLAYGRDGQAEEILKEALAKNPTREDAQLKLLEIYSARKDKSEFSKVANGLHKQTGGTGDAWLKAAGLGYALDPDNPLYEAGKDIAAAAPTPGAATDVDLDLGLGEGGTSTDITLDADAAGAAAGADTAILDLGSAEAEQPAPAAEPDFALEVPAASEAAEAPAETSAAPAADAGMMDFQIELPKAEEEPATQASPPAAAAGAGDGGLDFKLDDLDLGLGDDKKAEAPAGGEKDGHWYDVQTKFDLAKAYQEMGDKDGAKEILQEVLKEGDAEQKAQAKVLMDSLG